jgi:hypothetical protein
MLQRSIRRTTLPGFAVDQDTGSLLRSSLPNVILKEPFAFLADLDAMLNSYFLRFWGIFPDAFNNLFELGTPPLDLW